MRSSNLLRASSQGPDPLRCVRRATKRRFLVHIVFASAWLAALLAASPVLAEVTPFDGAWDVVLSCSTHNDEDDDAKGYTHGFKGVINAGQLEATHGEEGQPGWHFLHGRIHSDGRATLRLDGIVNNPKYAINDAQRGKRYSYRVKAQFEQDLGRGQRLTGRDCDFRFVRRAVP